MTGHSEGACHQADGSMLVSGPGHDLGSESEAQGQAGGAGAALASCCPSVTLRGHSLLWAHPLSICVNTSSQESQGPARGLSTFFGTLYGL